MQCQYSIECTRRIGCASIVTVLSPIKTQNYTHVFFLLSYNLYYSLRKIWSKNSWQKDICPKINNFEPPKTGTHLPLWYTITLLMFSSCSWREQYTPGTLIIFNTTLLLLTHHYSPSWILNNKSPHEVFCFQVPKTVTFLRSWMELKIQLLDRAGPELRGSRLSACGHFLVFWTFFSSGTTTKRGSNRRNDDVELHF